MRTRAVVYTEYSAKKSELDGITAKGDAVTVEEAARAEVLDGELDTLQGELDTIKKTQDIAVKNAARAATQENTDDASRPSVGGGNGTITTAKSVLPANLRYSKVRSFKGKTREEAATKAYRFGMFAIAALTGSAKAVQFCKEHGIVLKSQREADNVGGGFLVPDEFENDLIDLREEYGVFRRLAKNVPMTSDTKSRPRRENGLKAFAAGEGKAVAESQKGWGAVELIAKKIMVLARYSSEFSEDAIISVGDDLMDEIAYAFAEFEDECGWNGDGSGAMLKIFGVGNQILAVDADVTKIKGLVIASGNSWDEITLEDFTAVKGRLPKYARRGKGSLAWHASQSFYNTVMERLMLASGGVTAAELAAGRDQEFFMGYPVEISQVLPEEEADSQIACYFGNIYLAADFGDRRQTTIAMSTDAHFDTDEIAIRGTERIDINVHSVGNTEKAGPIVALRTAAN